MFGISRLPSLWALAGRAKGGGDQKEDIFPFERAARPWASKKQTLSTKVAEYTAFTEGSKGALLIEQLLL